VTTTKRCRYSIVCTRLFGRQVVSAGMEFEYFFYQPAEGYQCQKCKGIFLCCSYYSWCSYYPWYMQFDPVCVYKMARCRWGTEMMVRLYPKEINEQVCVCVCVCDRACVVACLFFYSTQKKDKIECLPDSICSKKKKDKTTQAVKTTPHINLGKGATLVPSIVKLLHRGKERKNQWGSRGLA
jgi:hypothetical protein